MPQCEAEDDHGEDHVLVEHHQELGEKERGTRRGGPWGGGAYVSIDCVAEGHRDNMTRGVRAGVVFATEAGPN